jgi:hypothetical protein
LRTVRPIARATDGEVRTNRPFSKLAPASPLASTSLCRERDDAAHRKAARQFSAGALRAWVPFLHDAIAPALGLIDTEERQRVFYRDLSDEDFERIARLVRRLLSHKVWEDPDPALNDLRYDDAERAKSMLRDAGLTPNWVLGGGT